jgi:hypothetical protein
MKRTKKSMKKRTGEYYSIPIGIIPNWLLKAKTGKDIWEHLVPDKEYRESLQAKVK